MQNDGDGHVSSGSVLQAYLSTAHNSAYGNLKGPAYGWSNPELAQHSSLLEMPLIFTNVLGVHKVGGFMYYGPAPLTFRDLAIHVDFSRPMDH